MTGGAGGQAEAHAPNGGLVQPIRSLYAEANPLVDVSRAAVGCRGEHNLSGRCATFAVRPQSLLAPAASRWQERLPSAMRAKASGKGRNEAALPRPGGGGCQQGRRQPHLGLITWPSGARTSACAP